MSVGALNKDVVAGFLIIAVAGLFALKASDLPMGTAVRMGPGYFPLILSGILGILGLAVTANGLRAGGRLSWAVTWRGLALVLGAVVFFGLAVQPLGFLPTLAVAVMLSTIASMRFRLVPSVLLTAGLVVLCWAVFIRGIGLPLQLVGPWLGGY